MTGKVFLSVLTNRQTQKERVMLLTGEPKHMNRKIRSVVKGLSWRAFAAFDTAVAASVVMFLRTGHFNLATILPMVGGIVGMELVTKTFLFAVHEHIWERDRKVATEPARPTPSWEELAAQMRREYAASKQGWVAE